MKKNILLVCAVFALGSSCKKSVTGEYSGTASVTTGVASTVTENLYSKGVRVAALGSITSSDGLVWTVPAEVNFANTAFPTASDLYNPDGNQFANSAEALAAFDPGKIVEIDSAGEVITGYIFADNYFELYINGVAVGKDAIPFTDFNSGIVKFRVSRPFTIAMKLVDWEERLGLGCETNKLKKYHPGDGGMVAVFKDASGQFVCKTDADWKAQTYYVSPIKDYACAREDGLVRNTSACNTSDVRNGSGYAALHWKLPADWMNKNFDDAAWPLAITYSNATIGVDGKPAFTNFRDVFDDANNDAQFIWSSNVVLDNEVIVRKTVR